MKLLTKYILKQFFTILLFSITSFVVLFLIIDIFEDISLFVDKTVNFAVVISYFLSKVPFILFLSLPIAVMLATMISLGLMGKNLELVAIKACGQSHTFIVAPIIISAFIISIFSFFGNEFFVPWASRQTEAIRSEKILKEEKKMSPEIQLNKIWVKSQNTIYYIDKFFPEEARIAGITIYTFDDDFHLQKRTMAEDALWIKNRWEFHKVIEYDFTIPDSTPSNRYHVRYLGISETPEDFMLVFEKSTVKMSYNELKRYINRLREDGYDTTRYEVDLASKLSYPLVSLLMAIIAVPFALMVGRKGGIASGVTISFALSFLYWIIYSICVSLGHGGTLPPLVAAWTANILFLITGGYMFITVRS